MFYSIFFIFLLFLQRGAGILAKIVLANTISPTDYGIITLVAISLPALFQLISTFNFYQILSHAQDGKKYFGFCLVSSIIITILISIALFLFSSAFFSYLNLPADRTGLFLAVIIISLFSISILGDIQGLLTGLKDYARPGILMALPSIIRLLAVIILFALNMLSFELIIFVFALANVVPLIMIACVPKYKKNLAPIKPISIPDKRMFAFGTAVFIITSFSSFGQYLMRIVISHNLGILWQGYFDVSLTLVSVLLFSLGTMSLISIPEATDKNANTLHESGGLGDVTRVLFAFMVLLFIILIFYADFITTLLFSKDFAEASRYVYILAIGYIFLFIQNFVANLNISSAKSHKDFLIPSCFALGSLPFFFFLTEYLITAFQQWGFENGFCGAYVAYLVIIIAVTAGTIIFSPDHAPIRILTNKIERLAGSCLVTLFILVLFNPPPILGIPVLIITFCIIVFTSGYINKKIILDIIRSRG